MNKRARNRLIGVTVILVISIGAIFMSVGATDGAYSRTVSDIVDKPEAVGERVKVTGTVVPGSWDGKSSPMTFDIRNEGATDGPVLSVVYTGAVPSTFGDEVTAIVTGVMNEEGIFESTDMKTKCPSRYESADNAISVASLFALGDSVVGKPVQLTGFVVAGTIKPPGGQVRFSIADEGGSPSIDIAYPDGALADGMEDGSQVVLGGEDDADSGLFKATSVAMAE